MFFLQVKFITHVWHPNIHPVQGLICLDILAEKWSPALSLRTTLLSIQALLSAPEPNDPLAISVGIQCKNNPEEYELTAKFWTYIYAKGQYQVYEYQEKLATLMSMGVEQILALKILSSCHWNLEEAIETFRNLNHIHYVINQISISNFLLLLCTVSTAAVLVLTRYLV